METIGSKWSYALTWCTPNNDDDDGNIITVKLAKIRQFEIFYVHLIAECVYIFCRPQCVRISITWLNYG